VADHPHAEVFMRSYAAFTAGDMEALADLFAEEVVWHTPATTRCRETTKDAMPPSRPSPESSSCLAGRMPWSSTTSWRTTTTQLRCFAARHSAAARTWT